MIQFLLVLMLINYVNSFFKFNVKKSIHSRFSKTLKCRHLMSKSEDILNVISWNINGIRALYKHDKEALIIPELYKKYSPDILCLQETKIQEIHIEKVEEQFKDLYHCDDTLNVSHIFWSCSTSRKGYSGTAIILLGNKYNANDFEVKYGIGEEEGDSEGRSITIIHDDFILVNVYVPNAGAGLKRIDYRTEIWDAHLSNYINKLNIENPNKRIILVGDMNVAHTPLDYHNPEAKSSKKNAGTTIQEQNSFSKNFVNQGSFLLDTYRLTHPKLQGYSYYCNRKGPQAKANREGWRIDYILTNDPSFHQHSKANSGSSIDCDDGNYGNINTSTSDKLKDIDNHFNLKAWIDESVHMPYSDHCPITASILLK